LDFSTPKSTIVEPEQKVVIVDVNMKFGSMVTFMVKWAIATSPALIILFIIGAVIAGFFGALFTLSH
jgi:hypothetical protein